MSLTSILSLDFSEPDIGVITLNDPNKGANVLSRQVLDDFEAILDPLQSRDDLAGLIIRSTKPGNFIAGADLHEFSQDADMSKEKGFAASRHGQLLFGRLAQCPFVTIAAIAGTCMGGGSELAVWCDRRIFAEEKTSFSFPEVKLGLFPGWGGTARTPRIVGASNAVEMVTSGNPVDARAAVAMGLASNAVPGDRLLDAAIAMVRAEQQSQGYLEDRRRWSGPISISETELDFLSATARAMIQGQTKGHYPAPIAALEVLLAGVVVDLAEACQKEAEGFAELFGSPVNRALLNLFFLQDANKKQTCTEARVRPERIESVSVLGAGIMGQGIAAAHVKRHIPVTLGDVSVEAAGKGVQAVLREVSYNRQTKGPDVEKALEYSPYSTGATDDGVLAASDMVIEAVFEDVDVKKEMFARLEPRMGEQAILCTNTSTIPVSQLAEGLERPEQFCGLHFFNPVRRMPLVEVIRGAKTSDQTIATAVAHAKRIGKSPIVVGDGPGFLVNRVLLPYMNEALLLLEEGETIGQIDRAATEFGLPMGPITLYDTVGLDVAHHAGGVLQRAFPDRVVPSAILPAMLDADRRGKKNGRGFFDHTGKRGRGGPSEEVAAIIQKVNGGHCRSKRTTENSVLDLRDRLFLPMLVEATRLVEDGIVGDVRDVDLGLIFGIGFPPFLGGLFFWADTVGAAELVERLEPLSRLGKRYQPTEMLTEHAKTGRTFYQART